MICYCATQHASKLTRSYEHIFSFLKEYNGSLLTRVKQSYREQEPVHAQASEAGIAMEEAGAVATNRSSSAAA